MSENLDLVRSIYADWERGDFSSTEWADPGIEYVIADGAAPGRWEGLGGLREGARSWISAWEQFRIEVDERPRARRLGKQRRWPLRAARRWTRRGLGARQ